MCRTISTEGAWKYVPILAKLGTDILSRQPQLQPILYFNKACRILLTTFSPKGLPPGLDYWNGPSNLPMNINSSEIDWGQQLTITEGLIKLHYVR